MPEQYDAMEKRLNARIRDLLYERDRMLAVIEAAKALAEQCPQWSAAFDAALAKLEGDK